MTEWQGYIEVPGGKIYAEADGDGPPVVFVHAGVAHLRMWDEQVAALRDAYRVIRYDTRGYGKTRVADDAPYSNSGDLGLVMDHFNVDSAHVAGLSRGAQIALDFAVNEPTRTRSLTRSSTRSATSTTRGSTVDAPASTSARPGPTPSRAAGVAASTSPLAPIAPTPSRRGPPCAPPPPFWPRWP